MFQILLYKLKRLKYKFEKPWQNCKVFFNTYVSNHFSIFITFQNLYHFFKLQWFKIWVLHEIGKMRYFSGSASSCTANRYNN